MPCYYRHIGLCFVYCIDFSFQYSGDGHTVKAAQKIIAELKCSGFFLVRIGITFGRFLGDRNVILLSKSGRSIPRCSLIVYYKMHTKA
jgi:hypothetical protein